jgi:hypothetical protein
MILYRAYMNGFHEHLRVARSVRGGQSETGNMWQENVPSYRNSL